MDHFGIGAALLGAAQIYFRSARQTGRTTSLLESVKDGDRIVVRTHQEEHHLKRMLELRGLKVGILVIDPSTPGKVFEHPKSQGRTIFDHMWVEKFYEMALKYASKELDHLQRESSGFGTAHYETRRRYEEMARWEP